MLNRFLNLARRHKEPAGDRDDLTFPPRKRAMATTCFGQPGAEDPARTASVTAPDAPPASPGAPDAGSKAAQAQHPVSPEPSAGEQPAVLAATATSIPGSAESVSTAAEVPPASTGGPDAGPQAPQGEIAGQPQHAASAEPSGAGGAAAAPTATLEEPELALEQMRLSIQDGLLMVLGPEGDPVPPHAFGAAAALRPDTPLGLPDGTSAPAFRVAAVLGAQLFGRLGAAEEGEAWIVAMLREGEGPVAAPGEALRAEQAAASAADALPPVPQNVDAAAPAAANPAATQRGVCSEPTDAGPRLAREIEGPSADLKLDVAADLPAADHAAADRPMSSWLDETSASDAPVGSNEPFGSDESYASEQVFPSDKAFESHESFEAPESPESSGSDALFQPDEAFGSEPVLRSDTPMGSDELFGAEPPSGSDALFQPDEPVGSNERIGSDEPIGSEQGFRSEELVLSDTRGPCDERADAPLAAEVALRSDEPVRLGQPKAAQAGEAREAELDPDSMVLVVMRGVPAGASLSTGIRDDDGSWSISPIDLATVTISLASLGEGAGEAAGGDRDLTITGIAFGEDGELVAISETVPLADYLAPAPADPAPRVVRLEVDPRPLAGQAFDALVIRGVPSGARLSAGAYDPAIAGWVLRPQDLSALALLAPPDLRGDFGLTLLGIALRSGTGSAARALTGLTVTLS